MNFSNVVLPIGSMRFCPLMQAELSPISKSAFFVVVLSNDFCSGGAGRRELFHCGFAHWINAVLPIDAGGTSADIQIGFFRNGFAHRISNCGIAHLEDKTTTIATTKPNNRS